MDRDFSQAAFPKTLRRSRSKKMRLVHTSSAIIWLTGFFLVGAPAAAQGVPNVSRGKLSVEVTSPGNPCSDGKSFRQGWKVRLRGDGFAGGAEVRLQFLSGDFSDDIGPTNANATGEINAVTKIPKGFPAPTGALIKANGPAPSGRRALNSGILDIGLPHTSDGDGDGIADFCDNCPLDDNPGQEDDDSDGIGNACDSCPMDIGNDSDGDGLCSDVDSCPYDANNDIDGDGICGNLDNCPDDANVDQSDTDGNGIGDACQTLPSCADGVDNDGDGLIDLAEDPGCSSLFDLTETDPSLPCDDGIDNDGDVTIDFRSDGVGDPACDTGLSPSEDPECDAGVDNDGAGAV
ncbi:MAG: thrombospondin type 3 repeat-containing protein, partial [Planctomycetes bacterium]|nr:thrombospondin type 3 repeat-containing protein [Planctomycetota bacterium]